MNAVKFNLNIIKVANYKISFLFLLMIFISPTVFSQTNFTNKLYDTYKQFKEPSLDKRRIKYNSIKPLVENYSENLIFKVQKVGSSIEGRDLNLISIGSGEINVFLWSQMHGNEPTATQSIFDILNFLRSDGFDTEKGEILSNLTLHFLPMLNPDGAEKFARRNALGIDINRDALRLQSPEGKTLKRVRDSLNADFGFNLHDQSTYYNAERTEKPATISYLAPAYNYEKEINEVRANSMKIIISMNKVIQNYAPGQVGRYNDDFEPRAFGDNLQKWGTSTILIESGGFANDIEKQEIRKLNYVSILSAIYTIAKGDYREIDIKDYEKIPENDRKLFDLKIKNATYNLLGKDYIIDLGINTFEVDTKNHTDFYTIGKIIDQGDLSTYYGYNTLEAKGYSITKGKVYPKTIKSIAELNKLNSYDLLKSGYTYLRIGRLPYSIKETSFPLNLIISNHVIPKFELGVGQHATFLLQKNNKIEYAVVNGFLIDLSTKSNNFRNALIYR